MMPEDGVNPVGAGGHAEGPEVAQRRAAIFDAMLAIADRRRRVRKIKQAAGLALGAAAAVALTVGVLGLLAPSGQNGDHGGATAANATQPTRVQPVQPKRDAASLPPAAPSLAPTPSSLMPGLASGGRGVERLDASKLRRVVVAEPLTDEAFEHELAMQGEYGTVRVGGRGGVLVLNNRSVAEDSPPRVH